MFNTFIRTVADSQTDALPACFQSDCVSVSLLDLVVLSVNVLFEEQSLLMEAQESVLQLLT